MKVVMYTDNEDFTFQVLVREDALEEFYGQGIVVGPPDLSGLPLSLKERKALQTALVKQGLVTAPDLKGKGLVLRRLLQELKLDPSLARQIINLYQIDYYGS